MARRWAVDRVVSAASRPGARLPCPDACAGHQAPSPDASATARARLRLTDRLADPRSTPRLILVAAPAGFGKTTLLTQWLASGEADRDGPLRVAWLSLDDEDSDLPRFLAHIVAALQTTNPDVGADALALLDHTRGSSTDEVLVSLINDLDTAAEQTLLALDDYHVIDAAAVHDAVTFLLDNLPPQVTLASRTSTSDAGALGPDARRPRGDRQGIPPRRCSYETCRNQRGRCMCRPAAVLELVVARETTEAVDLVVPVEGVVERRAADGEACPSDEGPP